MKRKYFIGLLIFITLTIIGFFIWHRSSISGPQSIHTAPANDSLKNFTEGKDSNNIPTPVIKKLREKDSIPENWKTYSNEKLGISFRYPNTWAQPGKEAEIINLSGAVIKTGIYFTDSVSKTRVSIEYSLDSNAVKIYQYASSQYMISQKSSINKKIFIAGNEAIKISKELKRDGKGKELNPPLRIIVVDFLDKMKKGEIQIQFQTPLSQNHAEENNFKQFLSSFKFIKS